MRSELTLNFTWYEAARSQTAAMRHIDNTIPDVLLGNVRRVAETLEEVRTLLGDHPIPINSWYRCRELNKAIGGSPRSAHMQGLAVDFEAPDGMTNAKAFELVATSDIIFDQLIHERTKSGADWIHLGLRYGDERRQVMAAAGDALGGAMTYRRVALG